MRYYYRVLNITNAISNIPFFNSWKSTLDFIECFLSCKIASVMVKRSVVLKVARFY